MAGPDRPPGQRSLFDFGVRRVAEKRPPSSDLKAKVGGLEGVGKEEGVEKGTEEMGS
jgi:hypothetical protein